MISVITASLPSRSAMLAEAIASVIGQTLPPLEHLIGIDHAKAGPVVVRNALLRSARGDRIAILDDDDLLYPRHLEALAAVDADVAYSFCDVAGRDWTPNRAFDPVALRAGNYIPITALIRRDLLERLGGFPDTRMEDWDLWLRALDAGARFACVPEVTWRYRFHGGNRTHRGREAA